MYVLFIILNEIEYLTESIKKMKEAGVRGATVIEGTSASEIVDNDLYTASFLASLVNAYERRNKASRVIFSLIEREEQVQRAMEEVQKILEGEAKKSPLGMMFVLPVAHMQGGELGRHIESRDKKRKLEEKNASKSE